MNRRAFIESSGIAALGLIGSSCSRIQLAPPLHRDAGAAWHLLRRAAYGPRPGDVDELLAIGIDSWIERQLDPGSIDDAACTRRLRRVEPLSLHQRDLLGLDDVEAATALRQGVILRSVHGERRLLEVMTELWSDHFNVYAGKEGCGRLAILQDRDAIRPHALGRFEDLLYAVAVGPAMLVYLDGRTSRAGAPNENYARELLELHALGVDGGYSQADVSEAARALTGWRVREHLTAGAPYFESSWHDDGEKRVLGATIPAGGGEEDARRLVDIVARHPSTAARVATKLCRRFLSDDPPESAVRRVADTFRTTGGDIAAAVRTVLVSSEFQGAPPRFRRPFDFAIAALRATGAETDGGRDLQSHLEAMGQLPFNWPTPDGFPDRAEAWQSRLLERWHFATALTAGDIRGTRADLSGAMGDPASLAASLLGRDATLRERRALGITSDQSEAVAVLLCSPAFQMK